MTPSSLNPTGAVRFPEPKTIPARRNGRHFPAGVILAALTWISGPGLVAEVPPLQPPAVTVDAALLESARKHIADSTPKGLSPLKEATVMPRTDKGIRVIEFTIELECDEPRYVVRTLQSGGKNLPGEVLKQLQSDGLAVNYLARIHGKGDAVKVHDSFNIRADGTCGAIKAFSPEKQGFLRAEQPDLAVEGDEKYLAVKTSVEGQMEAIAKVKAEKNAASLGSILNVFKTVGTAVGAAAGPSNPDLKAKTGAATDTIDAVTGQPAATPGAQAATPAPAPAAPVATVPAPDAGGAKSKGPATKPTPVPAPAPAADDKWLTPAEAAAILKISELDVYKSIESGDIKAKKFGTQYRIAAKELQ